MPAKYIRVLLLIYGIVNAVLYSSLLPLWEGFDEEFHYGYVQYLGAHHRFPVLGPTALSLEINRSLGLLPMSYIMIRNIQLKGIRTFDRYFALDSATRHSLYDQAHAIPTDLRLSESAEYYTNYEVHHAPLSYILMAIPDTLMSSVPLPWRVLIVRILASVSCVLLMFTGMTALGAASGLDHRYTSLLIFLMLSCQMFWATVAHIANDWLAIACATWLIVWAFRCHSKPALRSIVWLAVALGLGLLSKAYFLVFVPLYGLVAIVWFRRRTIRLRELTLMFVIPLVLAGPWYARNLILYKNISGRVEETGGVTTAGALKSLLSIPWLKSLPFMTRGTFWMGNAMFTDFSVGTMNLLLLLLLVALILFCRRLRAVDAFLWAPILLFYAATIYVAGSSYAYTHGEAAVASPWYLQAILAPLLCAALLGCQRAGVFGRRLAEATLLLWGYVLAATYVVKLIPLYGGFSGGRSTLRDIAHWYLADWSRTSDILSTTAMLPAPWLVTLLVILLATLLSLMTVLFQSSLSIRIGPPSAAIDSNAGRPSNR